MTSSFQRVVIGAAVVAAVTSSVRADCPCCTADGTQYYVDDLHGNDANDGLNVATAKSTIQAAVDLATAGDAVIVLPGEYVTEEALEVNQDCVTIRALGEVVVGSNHSPGVRISTPTGARVEGITFKLPNNGKLLLIENSSNVVIQRCRFTEGNVAVHIETSSNTTFRQCLFLRNHGSISGWIDTGYILVDACTFAWSGNAAGGSTIKNSVYFGPDAIGVYNFSHCRFYGPNVTPLNCPEGPNIRCDIDPLFIDAGDPFDPDNNPGHDIYYLQADSPLLSAGEDGRPIGAFGQGFHTSKDVSVDEPTQATTPWGNWIDSNGRCFRKNDPVCTSVLLELNDDDELLLKEGVTSAAIYSPVFDTGSQFTVIRSVDFAAAEDTTRLPGLREIIDAVQNTPRREINIRTSLTSFVQNPSTGPTFEAVDKQVKLRKRAQYVQMELVLRADGD